MRLSPEKLYQKSTNQKTDFLRLTRPLNPYPTLQDRGGKRSKLIKLKMKKGHNHKY
jgi:hypothetical protein